ncbi:hypothetical protein DdX_19833 [Ditylenchus destructor]|uniref:Uncharacterized protein n=1 Tax=Ditylenchus destructor TaxID=166010 RepID=A0AAD4MIB9_9BILA|nr:hypothetical protein DdX_19833 [Ditylenchus destructor]
MNSGGKEDRESKNENNAVSPTTILIPKEERRNPTKNSIKAEMATAENDTTDGCRMDTVSNERNNISRLQEATNKNFRPRSYSKNIDQEVPPKKFRQEVQSNPGQEVEKAKVNGHGYLYPGTNIPEYQYPGIQMSLSTNVPWCKRSGDECRVPKVNRLVAANGQQ